MINYLFEQLKASVEALNANLAGTLEEIRTQKQQIQQVYEAINMTARNIKYVREDDTLVISAPHIIIGNVDQFGRLLPGTAQIDIRGRQINNEAADKDGIITNRATTIQNVAVDPGIDGREDIVYDESRISNQARSIALQTNKENLVFAHSVSSEPGMHIISDTKIDIHAKADGNGIGKPIGSIVTDCTEKLTIAEKDAQTAAKEIGNALEALDKLLKLQGDLNESEQALAANYAELYGEKHEEFKELEDKLTKNLKIFLDAASDKMESNRKLKVMNLRLGNIPDKEKFKKESTNSMISLQSEAFDILSTDGDGNYRTNMAAKLNVNVPHVIVSATDKDGNQIIDSNIKLEAQDVSIDTSKHTYEKKENALPELTKTETSGTFKVETQKVIFDSRDKTYNDGIPEKNLNADSKFTVRANAVKFKATDKDGKLTDKGSFSTRFMETQFQAYDGKKKDMEGGKIEKAKENSRINLLAANTTIGTILSNKASKDFGEIALQAGKITAESGTALTLAQIDKKGAGSLELKGDAATIKGTAKTGVVICGDTQFDNNAMMNDIKSHSIETDGITVKQKIKTNFMEVGQVDVMASVNQAVQAVKPDGDIAKRLKESVEEDLKKEKEERDKELDAIKKDQVKLKEENEKLRNKQVEDEQRLADQRAHYTTFIKKRPKKKK